MKFSITITPDPVALGATYHVHVEGCRRDTPVFVDTTAQYLGNRSEYTADGDGRLEYDAIAGDPAWGTDPDVPPQPGTYAIGVQQMRGSKLAVLGGGQFTVTAA